MYSTKILQVLIDDAHNGLEYRPVVVMMIFNDRDEVLVVQSAKNAEWWGFPQGGIDPGETIELAAFREANEELGLSRRDLSRPVFHTSQDIDAEPTRADKRGFTKGQRSFFVSMRCQAGAKLALDLMEVSAANWVPVKEFPKLVEQRRETKRRLMVFALELCTT